MTQLSEEQKERELPPLSPEEAIQRLTHVLQLLESIESHESPLPKARVLLRGIIGCGVAAPLLDSDSQAADKAYAERTPIGIQIASDAATAMRDTCVATLKERADRLSVDAMLGGTCSGLCATTLRAAALALESLTLDQVKPEK